MSIVKDALLKSKLQIFNINNNFLLCDIMYMNIFKGPCIQTVVANGYLILIRKIIILNNIIIILSKFLFKVSN